MLASIIIPAYNAEPWIAEAIASAQAQQVADLEILVIDDGSSDRTANIVGAISEKDRRVRLISQSNAGPSVARNRGVRECRGEFVQYLDADDVLGPEKIAAQVARLRELPADWIATGPYGVFVGDVSSAVITREPIWTDLAPNEWLISCWSGGGVMPAQTFLIPRALCETVGPWLENIRVGPEDAEYFTRVITGSRGVAFVSDASSFVRRTPASRSSIKSDPALAAELRVLELITAHLLKIDNSPRTRAAAARVLQRFAYSRYPRVPALVRRAEAGALSLGGSDEPPGHGQAFNLLASAIGWKPTRWLSYQFQHLRGIGSI